MRVSTETVSGERNRWVSGVVSSASLVALLTGTVACGSSATTATAGSATAATPTTTSAPATAATGKPGGTTTPAGTATPEALMTTFVTDVLEQHYRKACLLNGAPPPGIDLTPAQACAQPQAIKSLTDLRTSWAQPGITLPPQSKVTVNKITPTGATATVTDDQVSVDGHTLNALMMIGSHNAQGFHVSWDLRKQQGKWLISSMNIDN
jgi:hypothetical protein